MSPLHCVMAVIPQDIPVDFVAAGWQRPMLMLTMLRQLYSKLLLQGTRQAHVL
jgi:hypothetical protein